MMETLLTTNDEVFLYNVVGTVHKPGFCIKVCFLGVPYRVNIFVLETNCEKKS